MDWWFRPHKNGQIGNDWRLLLQHKICVRLTIDNRLVGIERGHLCLPTVTVAWSRDGGKSKTQPKANSLWWLDAAGWMEKLGWWVSVVAVIAIFFNLFVDANCDHKPIAQYRIRTSTSAGRVHQLLTNNAAQFFKRLQIEPSTTLAIWAAWKPIFSSHRSTLWDSMVIPHCTSDIGWLTPWP